MRCDNNLQARVGFLHCPGNGPDGKSILSIMNDPEQFVVFRLDAQRYALALAAVDRIVRAVAVTALPKAPEIVMGLVNVAGRVLPVLNLRRRFGLPEREIDPASQFLIARTSRRTVVLVVDEAEEVTARMDSAVIDASQIVPGLGHVDGVVKLGDGLVLIHDLEKFLSLEEARTLDEAMKQEVPHEH